MIKIGYLGGEDPVGIETLEETQPIRVEQFDSVYLKNCPAIQNYYKNTYIVRCPFSIEFTITHLNDGGYTWEIHDQETSLSLLSEHISPSEMLQITPDGKTVQIRPRPEWGFISDTPNVSIFQHSNGIDTNPQIISGYYNIYDWPDRPLSIAYNVESGKRIKIKKGEPWYCISFFTPDNEAVKLIRMWERKGFLLQTRNKGKLSLMKKQYWPNIFKYFGANRPKKLIEE